MADHADKREETVAERGFEPPLRMLGKALDAARIYGPMHRTTQQAVAGAFRELESFFRGSERLELALGEQGLLVNGAPTPDHNPFFQGLERKLSAMAIPGFTLQRGLPREEFARFMQVLTTETGVGFAEALKGAGLRYASSDAFRYRRVKNGDGAEGAEGASPQGGGQPAGAGGLVDLDAAGAAGPDAEVAPSPGAEPRGGRWAEDAPSEDAAEPTGAVVQQIIAFLKGDVEHLSADAEQGLGRAAADAEKLTKIIMQAAVIRQAANPDGGESMSDLVLACLRRAFQGLNQARERQTPREKIELSKSMLLLEKTILDRLHDLMGATDPAADRAVSEALEDLSDELQIDALAAEYQVTQERARQTEKKLREAIRDGDAGQLKERLIRAGMSPAKWQELVVRSGGGEAPGTPPRPVGEPGAGFEALAVVLSKFDELMSRADRDPDEVGKVLSDVQQNVDRLTMETEKRIEILGQDLIRREDGAILRPEPTGEEKSRFLESILEITQELLQPLTVVNCTVSMTLSGYAGELNREQRSMLQAADASGAKLEFLMNRLIGMVGMPESVTPNKRIIYERSSS
jgi:hypothetical protein